MQQPPLKRRASEIAFSIARSLRSHEAYVKSCIAAGTQSNSPAQFAWRPGLYGGAAGMSMLMRAAEKIDGPEWQPAVHEYLTFAVNAVVNMPMSICEGIPGALVALEYAAGTEKRYTRIRAQLAQLAARRLAEQQSKAHALPQYTSEFDFISGTAGSLWGLRAEHGLDSKDLCNRLLWLSERAERWECVTPTVGSNLGRTINLGFSHGVSGPIMALSQCNIGAEHVSALEGIVSWLSERAVSLQDGLQWPTHTRDGAPILNGRASWCYGTPGIAAALWQAGAFLGRTDVQVLAQESMIALCRTDPQGWGMKDAALCHGVSGNAAVLHLFAKWTGNAEIQQMADALFEFLVHAYDESAPFGYRMYALGGVLVDCAGLLEGAAGIALALLAYSHDETGWMNALGMPV